MSSNQSSTQNHLFLNAFALEPRIMFDGGGAASGGDAAAQGGGSDSAGSDHQHGSDQAAQDLLDAANTLAESDASQTEEDSDDYEEASEESPVELVTENNYGVISETITVTGATVSESSAYLLFSVSGAEGQTVSLELTNLSELGPDQSYATIRVDTGFDLQIYDETNSDYDPADPASAWTAS